MMQVARQKDVTVIRLGSSYESLNADALDEVGSLLLTEATTAEPPRMVLDLSETRFIGSTFIELLVRAWKRLTERGGGLALCGLQPFCVEVLHVTRLDMLWPTYPSREEAIAGVLQLGSK